MRVTDAIADTLTRIRNAISAHHISVEIPSSNIKVAILKILCNEGFVKKFVISEDGKQGMLKAFLKYNPDQTSVITNLKRISKPGESSLLQRPHKIKVTYDFICYMTQGVQTGAL